MPAFKGGNAMWKEYRYPTHRLKRRKKVQVQMPHTPNYSLLAGLATFTIFSLAGYGSPWGGISRRGALFDACSQLTKKPQLWPYGSVTCRDATNPESFCLRILAGNMVNQKPERADALSDCVVVQVDGNFTKRQGMLLKPLVVEAILADVELLHLLDWDAYSLGRGEWTGDVIAELDPRSKDVNTGCMQFRRNSRTLNVVRSWAEKSRRAFPRGDVHDQQTFAGDRFYDANVVIAEPGQFCVHPVYAHKQRRGHFLITTFWVHKSIEALSMLAVTVVALRVLLTLRALKELTEAGLTSSWVMMMDTWCWIAARGLFAAVVGVVAVSETVMPARSVAELYGVNVETGGNPYGYWSYLAVMILQLARTKATTLIAPMVTEVAIFEVNCKCEQFLLGGITLAGVEGVADCTGRVKGRARQVRAVWSGGGSHLTTDKGTSVPVSEWAAAKGVGQA